MARPTNPDNFVRIAQVIRPSVDVYFPQVSLKINSFQAWVHRWVELPLLGENLKIDPE